MAEAMAEEAGAFASLLALKGVDDALDRLEHRRSHLPEHAALNEVRAQVAGIGAEVARRRGALESLAGEQAAIEAEIEVIVKRIAGLEAKLYGEGQRGARELQAMADEVRLLCGQRDAKEEQVIELMERTEPLEEQVNELEVAAVDLVAKDAELARALGAALREIDGRVGERNAERERLRAEVPESLRQRYEEIRRRNGGGGAAKVVGGSCGGCHLALSATERDHLQHAGANEVVTCEQCGAILVA